MAKVNQALLEMSAKQQTWYHFRETYTERFTTVMYDYLTLSKNTEYEDVSFSVERLGCNAYLFKGEVTYPVEATLMADLPQSPINDYIWQFECIERVAHEYHERKAEEARQAEVRRAAMEKLHRTFTDEEIKLLGVG